MCMHVLAFANAGAVPPALGEAALFGNQPNHRTAVVRIQHSRLECEALQSGWTRSRQVVFEGNTTRIEAISLLIGSHGYASTLVDVAHGTELASSRCGVDQLLGERHASSCDGDVFVRSNR